MLLTHLPLSLVNIYTCQRCNIENDFFSSDDLGRKLREAKPECCGSSKLLVKLSSMLHDMINEQVPDMRTKLERLLRETNKGLDDLGVSVSKEESSEALSRIIQSYSDAVNEHVKTSKSAKGFWQESKKIFFDNANTLRRAAPTFEVGGRAVFEGIVDVNEATEGDWSHANSFVLPFTKEQKAKMETITFPHFELDDITWEATLHCKETHPYISLKVIGLDEKVQAVDIEFKAVAAGDTKVESRTVESASLKRDETHKASTYVLNLNDEDLRVRVFIRVKVGIKIYLILISIL